MWSVIWWWSGCCGMWHVTCIRFPAEFRFTWTQRNARILARKRPQRGAKNLGYLSQYKQRSNVPWFSNLTSVNYNPGQRSSVNTALVCSLWGGGGMVRSGEGWAGGQDIIGQTYDVLQLTYQYCWCVTLVRLMNCKISSQCICWLSKAPWMVVKSDDVTSGRRGLVLYWWLWVGWEGMG